MRIPSDNDGLEGFACHLARQMKPVTLLHLSELLAKHAERRHAVLTFEQQWLGDRAISPRNGRPQSI